MKGPVTKILKCVAQFQSFYLCIYHQLFWIRQKREENYVSKINLRQSNG
jgi:hypothetical protein